MSIATQNRASRTQTAARRSPNTWVDGHPVPRITRRTKSSPPAILRFPVSPQLITEVVRPDALAERLESVQSVWSNRERELRRLQAIRKQEELLMLLADAEQEGGFRLAVADGEQPVLPPEIEILRN